MIAQHAASLAQPHEIGLVGDVVLDEGDDHDQQGHGEQRPHEVVDILQGVGQPAEQGGANHGQQEELAESHHDARDGQRHEGTGVGPMGCPLQRREPFDLAAGIGYVATERPLGLVEDGHGQQHDEQQGTAIRNQPVVAHLAPGFSRIGQRGTGVLDEGLDQVARLRRLGHRQAAVAGHPLAHIAPHGRVVTGLDLPPLGVGLGCIPGVLVGVRGDLEDVGAADAARRRRSRRISGFGGVLGMQQPGAERQTGRQTPTRKRTVGHGGLPQLLARL